MDEEIFTANEIPQEMYMSPEDISLKLEQYIDFILSWIKSFDSKVEDFQSRELADVFIKQAQKDIWENISQVTSVIYPNKEWRYIWLVYKDLQWNRREYIIDVVSYKWPESSYTHKSEIGTLQKLKTQESLAFQEILTRFQASLDALETTVASGDTKVRDGIYSGNSIEEMRYIAKLLFQEWSIKEVMFLSQNIPGKDDFIGLQKRYLSTLLGIQKKQPEKFTDTIQKSQEETDALISGIVSWQSIEESFEFLLWVHTLIDENNFQDATLQKNYAYFIDSFYEKLFDKIQQSVKPGGKREGDIMLYHQLASMASGRKDTWENLSMDSRLYRPDFAERVLFEAMKVQCSAMEKINEKMNIDDTLLAGRTPHQIINQVSLSLESTLISDEREVDGKKLLENDLKIPKRVLELSAEVPYTELSFEDKMLISTLARLIEKLKPKDEYSELEWIQEPKPNQELVQWVPGGMSGWPWYTQVVERKKAQKVDGKLLVRYMSESIGESAEFLWEELDSKLDMTFWEKAFDFLDTIYGFASPARDIMLREEDEIFMWLGIDPNSKESNILRLYNDIRGNWGVFELSDNSNSHLKTVGYMAAIVAGSMMLGGTVLLAARLGWYAVNSLLAEWAIYGVSSSVVSWGIDAAMWDATGYASNGEAIVWTGTDIVTAGFTGMLGGVLAKRFWKEWAKFLQEWYMKNKMIFAWDLAILGVLPEAERLKTIDSLYHNADIFTPEDKQIIPDIFQKTSNPQ